MKKFQTGFTIKEAMIVGAIICIILAVAVPVFTDKPTNKQLVPTQMQVPPPPQPTCVQGFLFTADGKQVINANGWGVSCLQ